MRGGSILLLKDTKGGDAEGDFIELDKSLWPPVEVAAPVVEAEETPASGEAAATITGGGEQVETARMPEPFQYPFDE
jgi:hypothetical protein